VGVVEPQRHRGTEAQKDEEGYFRLEYKKPHPGKSRLGGVRAIAMVVAAEAHLVVRYLQSRRKIVSFYINKPEREGTARPCVGVLV
jgi:hypothetical protein